MGSQSAAGHVNVRVTHQSEVILETDGLEHQVKKFAESCNAQLPTRTTRRNLSLNELRPYAREKACPAIHLFPAFDTQVHVVRVGSMRSRVERAHIVVVVAEYP